MCIRAPEHTPKIGLNHAFFPTSNINMNLSRRVVFRTPRRPANILELRTPKWMFYWEVPKNSNSNQFFEMLMSGCSKNSNNLFSITSVIFSGWMTKRL